MSVAASPINTDDLTALLVLLSLVPVVAVIGLGLIAWAITSKREK